MNKEFSRIISKINAELSTEMLSLNKIINDSIQSNIELIPELSSHLINSGGKRIRPIIAILSAKLFGYDNYKHILVSACIEFIHTATLLHDDVIDENHLRRGVQTANVLWDNKSSILVGDYLFAKAFELMVKLESLDILRILANTSSILAKGEILQMSLLNKLDITIDQYIEIIISKTASIFSSAAEVGAILGNANTKDINQMRLYGENLGIIFQIIDDILDYFGNPNDTLKPLGVDFNEGKVTLPIILLKQSCSPDEHKLLDKIFNQNNHEKNDFNTVVNLLNKYDIKNKSFKFANQYQKLLIKSINNIEINNKYHIMLHDIALTSTFREG